VARWRVALAGEALSPGDRVAMLLRNCPEWVSFDQAALSLGLVTVPLYTDDRADNAAYILQDAGCKVLLIQDGNRWRRLSEALEAGQGPQRVVLLDDGPASRAVATEDTRAVVAADWLPVDGPQWPQRDGAADALATIVYTSGTTGRPKGVMLSHANLLSNAHGSLTMLSVYQQDLFLSFLPLSHTLERTGSYYLPMMAGSTVAYARSVAQLAQEMQSVRPTVIIAVPSRQGVDQYQQLIEEVEHAVGRINGQYSTVTNVPIHFLHRGVPFHELCALYTRADAVASIYGEHVGEEPYR